MGSTTLHTAGMARRAARGHGRLRQAETQPPYPSFWAAHIVTAAGKVANTSAPSRALRSSGRRKTTNEMMIHDSIAPRHVTYSTEGGLKPRRKKGRWPNSTDR